jgi:hypothetical protein
MTNEEKQLFARRMVRLGYLRWDAVLRGVITWEECAVAHLEELIARLGKG